MLKSIEIRRSLKSLKLLIGRRWSDLDISDESPSQYARFIEVMVRTWDLGFTAFGGPPVHFQILYSRFVEGKGGEKWIDEQTYQELFAVCQGLPGPSSTKMLFCIALLRGGFWTALLVFFIWSLPGVLIMYGLSLGAQRMSEILPSPVYALLTGLNASTVGVITLAAVQLAEKAVKNKMTRILVIFGACAGICYNALWYFPSIMVIGGLANLLWQGYLSSRIARYRMRRERKRSLEGVVEALAVDTSISLENMPQSNTVQRRPHASPQPAIGAVSHDRTRSLPSPLSEVEDKKSHSIHLGVGAIIMVTFFASLIAVLLVRSLAHPLSIGFSFFANMYLAGTIIFGGGPVVIPLLRTYVVDPGWVSNRDFLFGLAIIQALPGPNFNFAVYLGALSVRGAYPTVFGAFLGFVGINLPGLALAVAMQGFWQVLRTRKWVLDILQGINATAVGLVFTAVYRLWQIGYLTPNAQSGQSLALNPWWVVVTAVTYAESAWFGISPPIAIVLGAVLGLCWYGTVGRTSSMFA